MLKTVRFDVYPDAMSIDANEDFDIPSCQNEAQAIALADDLAKKSGICHEVVEHYTDEETAAMAAKWSNDGSVANVTKSRTVYTTGR